MSRRGGWYIVVVLAFCNLLNYAQRNVLYSAYGSLRDHFHPSDASLGLLATAYMAAHALGTLRAGWLGDRVDRRKLLALAIVIWSVGALAAGVAPNMWTLALARAVTGFTTAAVVPVANAIIAEVFPPARKASVLAIFNLGLFVGGVAGLALGAAAGHPAGVLALGGAGLLLALLVIGLDVPAQAPAGADASPSPAELLRQFRTLLRGRSLRWLMVSTTLMAFAAGGLQAWLLDFLQNDKHMTRGGATGLLGVAFVAGLAGVITGGRVADRLRRRRAHGRLLTISLGMGCTVPCAALCIAAPAGPLLVVGSIATFFFVSWYHGPMAASVDDLAPDGKAVITQSLVIFTMHLFGTAPASWVVGQIKDSSGFTVAMLVPTAIVGLAALAMTRAFSSFGADVARAGGSTHGDDGAMTVFDG